MVGNESELGFWSEFFHVRMVRHRILVFFFSCLHHGGGIGVVCDDIGVLAHQCKGGIALLARVKPAANPDHLDVGFRIRAAHAAREGIDP